MSKSLGPVEAEMSLAALSCRCTTAASKSICGHGHMCIHIPEFLSFWGLSSFLPKPSQQTSKPPTNSLVPVQPQTSEPCVIPQNSSFDLWETAKWAPICRNVLKHFGFQYVAHTRRHTHEISLKVCLLPPQTLNVSRGGNETKYSSLLYEPMNFWTDFKQALSETPRALLRRERWWSFAQMWGSEDPLLDQGSQLRRSPGPGCINEQAALKGTGSCNADEWSLQRGGGRAQHRRGGAAMKKRFNLHLGSL